MSRLFDRIFGGTVDHPFLVVGALLLISSFALLGHIAPEKLTRLFEKQVEQKPAPASPSRPSKPAPRIPDVNPISLTDADTILVVKSKNFFTPEGSQALRNIVRTIDEQPYVSSVFWMDEVPVLNIFGLSEALFPPARASQRQFDQAREKALKHPLVGGQLLSNDGNTLLLLIKFDWLFVSSDEDCTTHLKEIAQEVLQKEEVSDFEFLVAGRVPGYLTFTKSQGENRHFFQIIGYSMILITAMILFRGIRAVLIVTIAPAMGVFWTLGIISFLGYDENPFNDIILPVLISLVGLTDGIHLMVEIRKQRSLGLSERDAARTGICKVGLACALTSLTTAIGFGSLYLAHHEIVREFGLACVAGVTLTFLSVVLTIPLTCSTWLGKKIHIGQDKGLIDRNLNRISGLIYFILARKKLFSTLAVGMTVLCSLVSMTLRPDERRANILPSDSEVVQAIQHMDQSFGGLETGSIEVRWNDSVSSSDPEILVTVQKVDDLLRQEELIGNPLSIRNFIDTLPGEGPPDERMPLLELLPPPLKRAFFRPEERIASVSFRVQDIGIAAYGPVFERIKKGLQLLEEENSQFTFEMNGSAVWRWKNLYQIVVDLALSLGSATVIIFIVLTIAYRSLRLGIISIVPNLFPLTVTGTFLVFSGQSLEIASVCAFTVCLGIAVDDTIHFLTRFTEELKEAPLDKAIAQAFTGTGTALILTTVVLLVGFSTVLLSQLRDQRIFAAMGALTIGSALFADLIFLPALLSYFCKSKKSNDSENSQKETASEDFSTNEST